MERTKLSKLQEEDWEEYAEVVEEDTARALSAVGNDPVARIEARQRREEGRRGRFRTERGRRPANAAQTVPIATTTRRRRRRRTARATGRRRCRTGASGVSFNGSIPVQSLRQTEVPGRV